MVGSGFTGFNPSVVENSIRGVISSYNELISSLGSDMQSKIINGMQNVWACKEAQDFFTEFTENVNSLIKNVNNSFEYIVTEMNNAGYDWAVRTGDASSFRKVAFNPSSTTVSASGIQENINGVRGIDLASATNIAWLLPGISASVSNAVDQARNSVNNCGFIGSSMEASLQGTLDKVKSNVRESIEGLATECKDRINSTVSSYGDLQGKVASSFAA